MASRACYILLRDVQGFKQGGTVKSVLKKTYGGDPYSLTNVLRGELVEENTLPELNFNMRLCRDHSILMFTNAEYVAPLNPEEFSLMEGIENASDRILTFNTGGIEFGMNLLQGSKVYVALYGPGNLRSKYVRATVKYKGRVQGLLGTVFGVELQESSGNGNDGTLRGKQYFQCEDGFGMFVPLSRLLRYQPNLHKQDSHCSQGELKEISSFPDLSSNKEGSPSRNTQLKSKRTESTVDYPSAFKTDDRVKFFDKYGKENFGTVKWTGNKTTSRTFEFMIVGIYTDEEVYNTDFYRSIPGLAHLLYPTPKNCALFLPETMVDKIQPIKENVIEKREVEQSTTSRTKKQKQRNEQQEIGSQSKQPTYGSSGQKELDSLTALQSENTKLKSIIQSKDKKIQDMTETLANKEAEVSDLSYSIRELRANLHHHQESLDKANHEIVGKQQTLSKQKNEIKSLSDTIKIMSAKLKRYEDLHDESWLEVTKASTSSWKIDRAEVERIPREQLGFGAWGIVYSGQYCGERVAIKYAHRELLQIHGTVEMIKREVSIMAHIQHPNLVRFIGAVLDRDVEAKRKVPIILLEHMDMNLRAAYTDEVLSHGTMLSLFCDVAYALHYLHEQVTPIIHRDVSAPNVLLKRLPNQSFRAKVSDFGSANLAKLSKTAGAGAIIYTPPEMFPQEDIMAEPPEQTVKVDVYSYGIVLLEVVSRELPVVEKRRVLLQACESKWKKIYDIVRLCTRLNFMDRPTMREILNSLNCVQVQ